MDEKVFDRVEKKYLITRADKRELLKLIKKHMEKDGYHKSEILNLYFDNDNYDLTVNSIDWVDFKEKIRARSYKGYDKVFMELKTKLHRRACHDKDEETDNNIGYKRRIMITHDDFNQLINHQATLVELVSQSPKTASDFQIATEIDYLLTSFNLKPKILITYRRESYKGAEDLRLTFDEKLKFRTTNLSFNSANRGTIYFKDDHNIIMEIKADGVMPLWLVRKLSELKLYPQPFSKIGKVYERIKNV